MDNELAGGNELTVACRAIAKLSRDDGSACRAYSVGNVGRVILAVDDEPAEQVPDLDQRVVQHLGRVDVDARHDNHLLQDVSVCGVLIIQEAVEVSELMQSSAGERIQNQNVLTMLERTMIATIRCACDESSRCSLCPILPL